MIKRTKKYNTQQNNKISASPNSNESSVAPALQLQPECNKIIHVIKCSLSYCKTNNWLFAVVFQIIFTGSGSNEELKLWGLVVVLLLILRMDVNNVIILRFFHHFEWVTERMLERDHELRDCQILECNKDKKQLFKQENICMKFFAQVGCNDVKSLSS